MANYYEIKAFLEREGYSIEKEIKEKVWKVERLKKKYIAKFDSALFKTLPQAFNENLIYEKFGNLEGLPKKIAFYENVGNSKSSFEDYILIKEYIEEKKEFQKGFKIPDKEKEKIINLITFLYERNFFISDINKRNFIMNPKGELYLIDFGFRVKKEELDGFEEDYFKMNLNELDFVFDEFEKFNKQQPW